jgi:hypothetical protein
MAEITLVRQGPAEIPEAAKLAAREVLFGLIDGLGERGKKQWRRFFNSLMRLEPGEMVEIRTHQERIGWYHRKHMALEQRVFESQEKFEHFEQFRTWLKVGSGFVDWLPGPRGGVIPVPRSISYAKLEQGAMEQVHEAIVAFLRTEHAGRTLWKHLSATQRIEQIEFLLARFEE